MQWPRRRHLLPAGDGWVGGVDRQQNVASAAMVLDAVAAMAMVVLMALDAVAAAVMTMLGVTSEVENAVLKPWRYSMSNWMEPDISTNEHVPTVVIMKQASHVERGERSGTESGAGCFSSPPSSWSPTSGTGSIAARSCGCRNMDGTADTIVVARLVLSVGPGRF